MERQELIKACILVQTKFGFKLVWSYFFKLINNEELCHFVLELIYSI